MAKLFEPHDAPRSEDFDDVDLRKPTGSSSRFSLSNKYVAAAYISFVSFATYFCVYGFRRPWGAGSRSLALPLPLASSPQSKAYAYGRVVRRS